MSRHQVEIHSAGPHSYRVLVDGADIAKGLVGLTLRMGVDQVPSLELDLQLVDVAGLGPVEAEVVLGEGAHEALVALGWTPPADSQCDPA
ncbi:hypothetical protein [Streptomyces sp. NPDC127040]|uniref:hypothetical protein n=1 Tax=Streptomyces sp. NPDC127040 TaxID=3347116 RepID=UPI003661DF08